MRDAHSADILPTARRRFRGIRRGGKPVRIDTVVVSTQHTEAISENELRTAIEGLRAPPADMLDQNTHIYVILTGRHGGPGAMA
ncbi:MAG: hypothetical protein ACLVJB_05110 [Christensenellales bacterium]